MKICRSCGKNLPLENYYQHPQMLDGHLNHCIDCVKARVKKHYHENPEKVQAYEKARASQPQRRQLRYTTTKRRRHEVQGYEAAHNALSRAVLKGEIIKPEICSVCRSGGRIEAHHEDYFKPLEVIWLCCKCHRNYGKITGACG